MNLFYSVFGLSTSDPLIYVSNKLRPAKFSIEYTLSTFSMITFLRLTFFIGDSSYPLAKIPNFPAFLTFIFSR